MENNSSVWMGWTYWAAGPWWGSGFPSIEPQGNNDSYTMMALGKHLEPGGGGISPDAGMLLDAGIDAAIHPTDSGGGDPPPTPPPPSGGGGGNGGGMSTPDSGGCP